MKRHHAILLRIHHALTSFPDFYHPPAPSSTIGQAHSDSSPVHSDTGEGGGRERGGAADGGGVEGKGGVAGEQEEKEQERQEEMWALVAVLDALVLAPGVCVSPKPQTLNPKP